MYCIFQLNPCCGCVQSWGLISLISTKDIDKIQKIIYNNCEDLTMEQINDHIYYGKRNDDIIFNDIEINIWFIIEEVIVND